MAAYVTARLGEISTEEAKGPVFGKTSIELRRSRKQI